jgi:HSP20 family protein
MTAQIRKSESAIERPPRGFQPIGWQVGIRSYAWSPPTDVFETENSFVVRAEVAGMREEDFSISVDKDFLVVSGVRCESQEKRAYQQMEIRFGEFSTAVELIPGLDIDHAEGIYKDGFLTITLPKVKPAHIKIDSKP